MIFAKLAKKLSVGWVRNEKIREQGVLCSWRKGQRTDCKEG